MFLAVILVPELCRKLGGTRGTRGDQVSSRSDCVGSSYDAFKKRVWGPYKNKSKNVYKIRGNFNNRGGLITPGSGY